MHAIEGLRSGVAFVLHGNVPCFDLIVELDLHESFDLQLLYVRWPVEQRSIRLSTPGRVSSLLAMRTADAVRQIVDSVRVAAEG